MSSSNASLSTMSKTISVHPNDLGSSRLPQDFDDSTKWVFVRKSSVRHPHSRRNPLLDACDDSEEYAGFYARVDNPNDIPPYDPAFAPIAAARRLGEKIAREAKGVPMKPPVKKESSSSSPFAFKPKRVSSSSGPRVPSDFEKEMVVGLKVDAVYATPALDGKLHYFPGVVRETRLAHRTGPNHTYEMDVRIQWDGTSFGPSAPSDWVLLHKVRHHQTATDFNTLWVGKWAGVAERKLAAKEGKSTFINYEEEHEQRMAAQGLNWLGEPLAKGGVGSSSAKVGVPHQKAKPAAHVSFKGLSSAGVKKEARATGGVMSSIFKGKGLSSAKGGK
ncbi:hypothetical protein T484DRAFT_1965473 [Baffinella frigidus]|nr:hypothetical protein T484DRAFT_1965473 [Cryptophyta sp. CCMP2293]